MDKEEKETLKAELLAASPFLNERFAEETFYKACVIRIKIHWGEVDDSSLPRFPGHGCPI